MLRRLGPQRTTLWACSNSRTDPPDWRNAAMTRILFACTVALRARPRAMVATLLVGLMASMLLAAGAFAQAGACDQLKATLAARIDPSIRGFSLETVPGGTPVPPGAKVIGTCEGGARKILFRRSAN